MPSEVAYDDIVLLLVISIIFTFYSCFPHANH